MIKVSFKVQDVVKKLLSSLSERSFDIIVKRYGLGKDTKKMTLEAIGGQYGITRERVRQIEEQSLSTIRKSDAYKEGEVIFNEIMGVIDDLGGVVSESELLENLSKVEGVKNKFQFILVVGAPFEKFKEDDQFLHRWAIDTELASSVENSIKELYKNLGDEEIMQESELIKIFLNYLADVSSKYRDEAILKRWLNMSKKISQNPLGEWGKSESPNINVKGVRDYAYLVIRKHGSPIHFKELAEQISTIFNRKAHVATCHNELIKDSRFVLVGRGLYALADWGYAPGVVRDVISNILEKNGPLTKEEIIQKVLKERYVKENTVIVNLQNNKLFKKTKEGKYTLA